MDSAIGGKVFGTYVFVKGEKEISRIRKLGKVNDQTLRRSSAGSEGKSVNLDCGVIDVAGSDLERSAETLGDRRSLVR